MITDPMKYKALLALSNGPKTSTELYDLFKSRGSDYRQAMANWLEDKMAAKYRVPAIGRPASVYSIEPKGVRELERLKLLMVEN